MIGRLRRALGLVLLLIAIGLAAFAVWFARPGVAPLADDGGVSRSVPTRALAEATLERIERFRAGTDDSTLALGDAEIASVLRFALPGGLPTGVIDPEVRLAGNRITLSARVATRVVAELSALDPLIALLPDTIPVRIEGTLGQLTEQSLVFRLDQFEAAEIPVPERLVSEILSTLGHTQQGGSPGNTLHIPLHTGMDSVYVVRDSLVLLVRR